MGNIMLCGSLCQNLDVANENNQTNQASKNQVITNDQAKISDQILINEIFEREKLHKIIEKEITYLKLTVDTSVEKIKQYCDNEKKLTELNLQKISEDAHKSITEIEDDLTKIKEKRLFSLEQDINIVKTKLDNLLEDLKEIKDSVKNIQRNVIQNTTTLEILVKK